jgi:leader peptidase (prepilin peptidase)/N-methyltransferase
VTGALAGAAALAGVAMAPLLDLGATTLPREPIEHRLPARRLVFAGAGAGLLVAMALRFGWSAALLAYVVLATGLLLLSVIDIERFLLPDVIVYPLTVATGALLALAAVVDADSGSLPRAGLAALVAGGAFALLHAAFPAGLAAGDVKLAVVLGLSTGWIGWGVTLLGFVLAFVGGAAVAGALVLTRRRSRRDPVPFGPFLAAGAVVAILVGDPILNWYTGS